MAGYLQDGETYESRLLDLLTEVRRAPQDEVRERRTQEASVLASYLNITGQYQLPDFHGTAEHTYVGETGVASTVNVFPT